MLKIGQHGSTIVGHGGLSFYWGVAARRRFVEVGGPEIGGKADHEAPDDAENDVITNCSAGEQAVHGLGDRGVGLVLGELPQPDRHRARSGRIRCRATAAG